MKISFRDNWKKYLIKKARQITERELAFIDHHQGVGQALKYVITFNPYYLLLLPVMTIVCCQHLKISVSTATDQMLHSLWKKQDGA